MPAPPTTIAFAPMLSRMQPLHSGPVINSLVTYVG